MAFCHCNLLYLQSFQDKGYKRPNAFLENSCSQEPECGGQWISNVYGTESFLCKKQAVDVPITMPESGIIMCNALPQENSSGFQSVPNEDMDQLFGCGIVLGTDGSDVKKRVSDEQVEKDSSGSLSVSDAMKDSDRGVSFVGIGKVEANQVKDPENRLHTCGDHELGVSMDHAYTRGSEKTVTLMGRSSGKEDGSTMLMRCSYDNGVANNRSMDLVSRKGINNSIPMTNSYNKRGSSFISFGSYQDVMEALATPVSSYSLLYEQPSVRGFEMPSKKEVDVPIGNAIVSTSPVPKSRLDSTYRSKSEKKPVRKEAPHSFLTNVKSLLNTGMLDGVSVRYISGSREKELHGTIKGSGYLCGCQSCNYSEVLNAYEFERHAGCKTSHPNNHIHFENGKTIHQIVQELKTTPQSMLIDAIQTLTGSVINQKASSAWKESSKAVTHKHQSLYAKEELNLCD
ncbi:UNVERIFIED_CONTAM: hypothetical protein Slati_0656900 [Sesamum latifolium]|uniref:Tify domain-containing protein n=1 Tax=Sesamum latifolium TaxID=2727402 RepID=A0AAW2Y3N1_9LAMI